MEVPEVDVAELARALADGAPVLDVRNPDEYDAYHVPGAQLIPLPELAERLDEVPTGDRLYVICHGGGRSRRAAEGLIANGFDAVNVAGGSAAWVERGHPVATGPDPG